MSSGDPPTGGLFDSLRRMLEAAAGLAQRRLELFAVEAQEEKLRVLDLLLRATAVIGLSLLALVTATATVVVALWDTSPVLVLVLVTAGYGIAATVLAAGIRRRLREGPKPFAGTIEEFRKDRECLGKRN